VLQSSVNALAAQVTALSTQLTSTTNQLNDVRNLVSPPTTLHTHPLSRPLGYSAGCFVTNAERSFWITARSRAWRQ
jgi:hypothetical protein